MGWPRIWTSIGSGRRRPPRILVLRRRVPPRRKPLCLIVAIGRVRVHGARPPMRRVVVASRRSRGRAPLHIGQHAGRSRGHGLGSAVLGHTVRGYVVDRGRGHRLRTAGGRIGTEDVGEGGISLRVGRRAVSALIVLIAGHDVALDEVAPPGQRLGSRSYHRGGHWLPCIARYPSIHAIDTCMRDRHKTRCGIRGRLKDLLAQKPRRPREPRTWTTQSAGS